MSNQSAAQIQTVEALPRTVVLRRDESTIGESIVEFRLVYEGPLPSENSRSHPKIKHNIRKVFQKQLAELWRHTPCLVLQSTECVIVSETEEHWGKRHARVDPAGRPWVQQVADEFTRHGFRFVPLVRKGGSILCSLDILFLRRDAPGSLIKCGGDIDNRIKVLFDSLRIVDSLSELAGAKPDADEDPFFVLLEDDFLITQVTVTTDRLLAPVTGPESVNDVSLIIHVKLTDPGALFTTGRLI